MESIIKKNINKNETITFTIFQSIRRKFALLYHFDTYENYRSIQMPYDKNFYF